MKVRWHTRRCFFWGLILATVVFYQTPLMALTINEAVNSVANRLQTHQIKKGSTIGYWQGEMNLTGSIIAGMVSAYELGCNIDYKESAELGGDFIVWAAQENFYGDEMYALTRLSQISSDPCDNPWRSVVSDFYESVKHSAGGTENYISNFYAIESSTAVFYLANHVVAAYYVDAADKKIWRQKLINFLSRVDDSSYYPVMALGAATWSLARTGSLDGTSIHSSGEGAPYWELKKLSDLPDLLLSYQVQDGQPGAGSFYWQFGHTDNSPNGYTEDAIFATRGLVAAYWANPDPNLESAIPNAREALLNGISSEGVVWERLSQEGSIYYTYGGEMLQVLGELVIPGDLNLDGNVNFLDYALFVNRWELFANDSNCSDSCLCWNTDLDRSGKVNYVDFNFLVNRWLNCMGH
jgi:hypothetical protein